MKNYNPKEIEKNGRIYGTKKPFKSEINDKKSFMF